MLGELENRIDIIGAEDVQAGEASDRPDDGPENGAEDVFGAGNDQSWRAFAANAPAVFVRAEIGREDGQLNFQICGYGCFAGLLMALLWCH